MSVLFHSVRCVVKPPYPKKDYEAIIEVPGGMDETETWKWWADLEDEYGVVSIEPIEKKDKRLLFMT
jgi:hypothetical protein